MAEKKVTKHKIARIVVSGKQYYKSGLPNYAKLGNTIKKFVEQEHGRRQFEFLVTPGGFLSFDFPDKLFDEKRVNELEDSHIEELQQVARISIDNFLASIDRRTLRKLSSIADYFTIGIDGFSQCNWQHIELVGLYDLRKGKVIHWTGKFYPTERQKRNLVKINDLNTHFVRVKKQNVVVLGCHDLNVFNPRGQAATLAKSSKGKVSEKFRKAFKQFKPEIILHHPHTTDTPNIWNLAWRTIEKDYPDIKHFASGIKYFKWNGEPRGDLQKVLAKTKKGDVIDFVFV